MKQIISDKRQKYNSAFTIWKALDCRLGLDFKILGMEINRIIKRNFLVLKFMEGYKDVSFETLENICTLLQNSYPNSEFKVEVRQCKYIPEQKENVLLALCR